MHRCEVTDEMLLNALKNHDSYAFEAIYHRYWRRLFVFVYQQMGSKDEAEEVLQDLMLSLWQNRSDSNIRNLRSYLFIAARNLVNMHYRKEINLRKYREFQLMQEVMESIPPENAVYEKELLDAIEKVLEKLPEKTACIFRMNKLDHVSVNKIATHMGLSDKAVEYHLSKSMKVMRKQLQRYLLAN
ncbi:RNA polymerase sigma factor [Parapedobacter indicus]|uniref:RNA polymerase sigma-70 factor, ECF subfamily n=1 Tax=Parapedobacter indicus TaxID=1477437 RepID=A0A1I3TDK0_9SPHI|nr:sigma-70 family RNA polymerase sigma factor [Parapedobacter indicus]PPK99529.1 RNA polymerase sigma-70 factor (ECF subfamily) [Parapedobacter indicus]SFJ69015.1 RNA polymerase sigma-70 factor, ECF subfamily [Parapedobacter indicus]